MELRTIKTMMGIFKEFERSSSGRFGGGPVDSMILESRTKEILREKIWRATRRS
jgi:hypothetical protein